MLLIDFRVAARIGIAPDQTYKAGVDRFGLIFPAQRTWNYVDSIAAILTSVGTRGVQRVKLLSD
jgi:hypothetical protein